MRHRTRARQAEAQDDEETPGLRIGDASITEPPRGTGQATFSVTVAPPSSRAISVRYTTVSRTATAGADFAPTGGTLTFDPGETTKTIAVLIVADELTETIETFAVVLSEPTNAGIVDGEGEGAIADAPLAACLPRPDVAVSTARDAGRLRVTVSAQTNRVTPTNALIEIRFGAGTNVVVETAGQTSRGGPFALALPSRPASFTFHLRRVTVGQAHRSPSQQIHRHRDPRKAQGPFWASHTECPPNDSDWPRPTTFSRAIRPLRNEASGDVAASGH